MSFCRLFSSGNETEECLLFSVEKDILDPAGAASTVARSMIAEAAAMKRGRKTLLENMTMVGNEVDRKGRGMNRYLKRWIKHDVSFSEFMKNMMYPCR